MTEFVTPDGEVVELLKTPYQEACTALVAFKLRLIETVTADPRLHSAPCVQAMVVYLSFLTVDKEKLSPSAVYASTMTLMARGGIKSDRTARNARNLLIDNGYLKPSGKSTKDGCVRFEVANPHYDRVAMHVREAAEYYQEREADRKKDDNRRDFAMITAKVIRKRGGRPIKSIAGGPDRVKVGFPAGEADSDVISRAVYNNFGTSRGIPERPFMQNSMRAGRGKLTDLLRAGARAIIHGAAKGENPQTAKRKWLGKAGIAAQGMIQSEITSLASPPNAPSTIRQKGSSNPLIDSGEMRGAVSFKIED